ncbi:glycoside hydrolase superfamily [Gorgonomyces haynaldii]|nr:glycoside hydrolase superfamily [Gorgonomyces haynaldii]
MLYFSLFSSYLSQGLSRNQTAPSVPLSVQGNQLVDKFGNKIRLSCTEWSGSHLNGYVVSGLHKTTIDNISQLIAQKFNCVRLSFSIEMVYRTQPVEDYLVTSEPLAQGKTPMEVYDLVIASLTRNNLMIILDNQMSNAGWCCDQADNNGLWYNEQYDEETFFKTWELLASRYRSNPLVVGADIRNEVRPVVSGKNMKIPYWGSQRYWILKPIQVVAPIAGFHLELADWEKAAQTAANRILAINPDMLISVGAVYDVPATNSFDYLYKVARLALNHTSLPVPSYLPDLTKHAIKPENKVVYSIHEYIWLHKSMDPQQFENDINQNWATNLKTHPIFAGEIGTDLGNQDAQQFWNNIAKIAHENDNFSWSIWCIDGTQGPSNGRVFGTPESYGLLNPDWNQYRDMRVDVILNHETQFRA